MFLIFFQMDKLSAYSSYLYLLLNRFFMESCEKEHYETPATVVLEVKTEGIVCASQMDYNYGNLDEE